MMGNIPDFCGNLSQTANQTYGISSECWTEKIVADILRTCLPLIILPVSLICNFLSFIALQSRQMRGTSTAFFMLALSLLDPLVLLTKNLVYFPTIVAAHAISCKILYFFIYVLGYTNVWILVIMTADKFFAVWSPLKVSYFCTITRAKYVCVLLAAISSVISFHHFWTINSIKHPQNDQQRFCHYDMVRYGSIQRIWRYTDFVIWCFLPFVLILTLSVLIIYKLRKKRQGSHPNIRYIIDKNFNNRVPSKNRLNKQQFKQTTNDIQTIEMRSNQNTEVIRSRHRHITLMLLAVAVVFLLLTLPNSIYFVLDVTYGFNEQPTENDYYQWLRYRRLNILTVIMYQLSDLQHATNFFLYLLTSDKFRRSILMICSSTKFMIPSIVSCCRNKTELTSPFQSNYSSRAYKMTTMSLISHSSDVQENRASQRQTPTHRKQPVTSPYHSLVSKNSSTYTNET